PDFPHTGHWYHIAVIVDPDPIKARLDRDRLALLRRECEQPGETNVPHAKRGSAGGRCYHVFRNRWILLLGLDHAVPSIGIFRKKAFLNSSFLLRAFLWGRTDHASCPSLVVRCPLLRYSMFDVRRLVFTAWS